MWQNAAILAALVVILSFAQPCHAQRDPDLEKLGAKKLVESGFRSSWSPDGNQLVYGLPRGKGIRILDLKTGKTSELTDHGKDPVWSPDGREIAYVTEKHFNEYKNERVWIINPKDSKTSKLVDGTFPVWSKDGKTVYCYSHEHKALVSIRVGGPVKLAIDKVDAARFEARVGIDRNEDVPFPHIAVRIVSASQPVAFVYGASVVVTGGCVKGVFSWVVRHGMNVAANDRIVGVPQEHHACLLT